MKEVDDAVTEAADAVTEAADVAVTEAADAVAEAAADCALYVDGVETEDEDGRAKGDAGAVEELWAVGRSSGTWQTEPEPGRRDP